MKYTYIYIIGCLVLGACADQWNDLEPEEPQAEIAFSSTVVTGRGQTRADGTIVNKNVFALPASSGGEELCVGIFGYHTGASTWNDVVGSSVYTTASAFDAAASGQLWGEWNFDPDVLLDEKGPTADLFYNLPLKIAAAEADGRTNHLHYQDDAARRFWPNNGGGTDKLSFWAYYPYNATSAAGDYGIDILEAGTTPFIRETGGRGKIRFRMSPEASKNVDFLVSDLVTDATKQDYPLLSDGAGGYVPKRVPLIFRHMLAQVRLYANIERVNRLASAGVSAATWSDEVTMTMSFNHIKMDATYTLTQHYDTSIGGLVYPYVNGSGLGSVTVDNYVENSKWFKDRKLDEDFMYGDANYAPGNIILAVPQQLSDDNVPTITLVLTDNVNTDPDTGKKCTARVTINMLNMNIKWEQGFIYSYAFIDQLKPGDDIVRGPETIEVGFDPVKITDQW